MRGGHSSRRVLGLFADRDKRYAHPFRINKAIIIITLHNELCFICLFPFCYNFQELVIGLSIVLCNLPGELANKSKYINLTTFAAISTPYRQLLLCRSCFLLRLLSCITIITIIVVLPTHTHTHECLPWSLLFSVQKNLFELLLRWSSYDIMFHVCMYFPNTHELFPNRIPLCRMISS